MMRGEKRREEMRYKFESRKVMWNGGWIDYTSRSNNHHGDPPHDHKALGILSQYLQLDTVWVEGFKGCRTTTTSS